MGLLQLFDENSCLLLLGNKVDKSLLETKTSLKGLKRPHRAGSGDNSLWV